MSTLAARTITRLRAEEFELQFANTSFCEFERGEVVLLTAGDWKHSSLSAQIVGVLGEWARLSGKGRVLTGETGIITSRDPDTVRGIDVAYFSFERVPRGKEPESIAEVAPTLAVEIVGKGQGWKKMTEKAAEYLRIGADRVWVVDPNLNTLHVFTADQPPREYGENDTIENDPALPGFGCRVRELLAD